MVVGGRRGDARGAASGSRPPRSRRRARTTSAAPTASCARRSTARSSSAPAGASRAVGPVAGVHYPIAVVRMAVGDAYGAEQWREARRTATRSPTAPSASRAASAARSPSTASAPPSASTGASTAGPKWTVSPVYEGMLKEEMDAAAERHPEVPTSPVLIDATYAGLISRRRRRAARDPRAQPRRRLPVRPRDADVRLDRGRRVGAAGVRRRVRAERRDGRGAARDRAGAAGQGHRQPDGDDPRLRGGARTTRPRKGHAGAERASRAIYESVLEATATGVRTPDLGGHATHDRVHRRGDRGCARRSRSGPRSARCRAAARARRRLLAPPART